MIGPAATMTIFGAAAGISFLGARLCSRVAGPRIASAILAVGFKAVGWLCLATAAILLLVLWTGAGAAI